MRRKVDFKYEKEVYSFYNKKFINWTVVIVVLLILFGLFTKDLVLLLEMVGLISVFYIAIAYRTIKIGKEKKYFKKKGTKCEGLIKGIKLDDNYNCRTDDFTTKRNVVMVVEYKNPYTNCEARFATEPIYGNPYSHLKSLVVTVYVLEDGKAYATGFKKIRRERDAIKYHDERLKESLEKEDK